MLLLLHPWTWRRWYRDTFFLGGEEREELPGWGSDFDGAAGFIRGFGDAGVATLFFSVKVPLMLLFLLHRRFFRHGEPGANWCSLTGI